MDELAKSYIDGYTTFREQTKDINTFYTEIKKKKKELNDKGRKIASDDDLEMFNNLMMNIELSIHTKWIEDFSNRYNN